MSDLTINITKYDPYHTDFENPEYFPTTILVTYNQMIDVISNPFVTLVACTLSGQEYLATYGEGKITPIQKIDLQRDAQDELEALAEESIIIRFSTDGTPFGTSVCVFDLYRGGELGIPSNSPKRSKEADSLAIYLGIHEDNPYNEIEYTPETLLPTTVEHGDPQDLATNIYHYNELALEIRELTTKRSELLEQADKLDRSISDRIIELNRRNILVSASITITKS